MPDLLTATPSVWYNNGVGDSRTATPPTVSVVAHDRGAHIGGTNMTQDMVLQLLDMLQQGTIECVTIGGMDIIYNAHMDDGEWELFDHYGDHTSYTAYGDIYECSGVVLSLIQ